jgi:hypothetical protein
MRRAALLQAIQHLGWFSLWMTEGEDDMTPPTLWSPEGCQINDPVVDRIASLFERMDGHVDDLVRVVLHGRDVLDQHECRTKDARRSGHPGVKGIPRVLPPRVVVQVRMALARGSSDEDIDGADASRQPPLLGRQRAPVLAIDELLYTPKANVGSGEIRAVHSDGVLVQVDRERDVDPKAYSTGGLRHSK